MTKEAKDKLAAMEATYRKAGETMWETPAGAHAIKLLAVRVSVTIDDIIASLEEEGRKSPMLMAMHEQVIARLRDLQARRRSG